MHYKNSDCNNGLTRIFRVSLASHELWFFVVSWYLVFEMGGISLDKAALITMILESLLYGSRHKSFCSCSITNIFGSGIFTVMFGFTLWVLIHERRGQINMRLLLPALVLYALATAVSHLIVSMPRIIHFMLDCFKHLAIDVYRGVKAFITYRDAPGGPMAYLTNLSSASNLLRSSFYVLQTLLGDFCMVRKYHCYYHLLLHSTWYHFADLPVLSHMATQYMDNNTTDLALDILCR